MRARTVEIHWCTSLIYPCHHSNHSNHINHSNNNTATTTQQQLNTIRTSIHSDVPMVGPEIDGIGSRSTGTAWFVLHIQRT